MASYTHYEETKTLRIYELPCPSNWAELSKMFSGVSQNFEGLRTYDDTVEVTVTDDAVQMSFDPNHIKDLSKKDSDIDHFERLNDVLTDIGLDSAERATIAQRVRGFL